MYSSRKSKIELADKLLQCDGVRPKCNTCQSKNLTCVYDVAEDGKTTTQLRAHVRRLAKELDDMKSVVSLLAIAPDRTAAANWASELEKNGFAHHSVDEIKRSLGVSFVQSVLGVFTDRAGFQRTDTGNSRTGFFRHTGQRAFCRSSTEPRHIFL